MTYSKAILGFTRALFSRKKTYTTVSLFWVTRTRVFSQLKLHFKNRITLLQVLIAEKAMAKAGVAPTMLAKALQLQKALAEQGVAPELISEAISELLQEAELPSDINFQDLLKGGISPEDVNKMIALSKSFNSSDKNTIKLPDLNSKDAIKKALKQACENDLKKFAKTVMAQKAMAASGATPEQVAKVAFLTKSMAENGMTINEIANALTMALTLPDGASPGI